MKLDILQIGAGSMGSRRLRDLSSREDVRLSLFDASAERRDRAAQRFGVRTYADIGKALEADPTALVISTPPDAHAQYVEAAIERRLHFFCEADVWNEGFPWIERYARESGRVCAPSSSLKLMPIVEPMKRIVEEELGALHAYGMCLSVDVPSWHPGEGPEYYARRRHTAGGREMVAFELGYLNHIFGSPVSVAGAVGSHGRPGAKCEDTWSLQLSLECGGAGHFTVLSGCPVRNRRGWAAGSNGFMQFDIAAGELEYSLNGRQNVSHMQFGALGSILEGLYKEEIDRFVDAVLGKGEYYFTYGESAMCTATLAAAERSARFGQAEKVDVLRQPALYPDSYRHFPIE